MHFFDRRLFAIATLLLAQGSVALRAQDKADEEIIPPVPIYKVDPTHPAELYARGVEGEAIIIASIDRLGTVTDPIIDRTSHDEFGLAALLAASEWIFEPATKNGVPIALRVKIPFTFKIAFEQKLNIEQGREVFKQIDVPIVPSFELDKAPVPKFIPAFDEFYPKAFANTGKSAAVSVEFIVNPEGNVINPRIISASTPGFGEAAMRAVSRIQYQPIRVQGQTVYVSIMMPIQFSP